MPADPVLEAQAEFPGTVSEDRSACAALLPRQGFGVEEVTSQRTMIGGEVASAQDLESGIVFAIEESAGGGASDGRSAETAMLKVVASSSWFGSAWSRRNRPQHNSEPLATPGAAVPETSL
jgi:hypothetical protein